MVHWMWWIFPFSHYLKRLNHTIQILRGLLTTSPIWSGVGVFYSNTDYFFPIAWMCRVWLNVDLFSWRLVLKMFLSLRAVMTWTLFYFPVSCWLEIASKTVWTIAGSFMSLLRIHTLVQFFSGKAWFCGQLFVDWDLYYMLWCLQYCTTILIRVNFGGKSTWTSNISSLMKVWSEGSIFNVGSVKVFFTIIS